MIHGCKVHFGQHLNEGYYKDYLLPGHTDVLGVFDERSGNLVCHTYLKLFFPVIQECSASKSTVKRGLIYVKNEEVSYDNCIKVIAEVMDKVTNTQTEYSIDIEKEGVDIFTLCYKAEVRNIKYLKKCPSKYRDYRIDVRNFMFKKVSDKFVKSKRFFRSPSVTQYEHLKAIGYPVDVDDYDYESHENEYDTIVAKSIVF